ncbi:MAG TPA: Phenylacetic acid catabolic protein [Candidatus Limnocylindria bacterium]|jgi:ring-1,2-phenylacetyl-CoA epoxidase subunit PaaA|nr:Phenylacetic acid catabolic protein [Candidatus Limnocylindria bacterium]
MSQFNDKVMPKDFPKMPPEYKDLLIRLLTIQADCEIGGPHIYVDHWTLRAPTVDDQWRVARIASEEIDHCRKMLRLLNLIDVDRSDILERPRSKREVDAFKEDMPTWADFAAFGFLIDKVGEYQLEEMVGSTFAPIDDTLPVILREEKGHVAYGEQQLQKLIASGAEGMEQAQAAITKWYGIGLDMFGKSGSSRTERYLEWGLKRRTNEEARRQYIAEMEPQIAALGLVVPDRLQGRKYL